MLIYKDKNNANFKPIIKEMTGDQFKISKYVVEHTDINTFQVELFTRDEFGYNVDIYTDEIVLFEDVEKLFQDLRFNYLNKLQGVNNE